MNKIFNINSTLTIFIKDFRSELRTRYALNALIMFVITTLAIILFAVANETPSIEISAGILWIVIFFSAMSGMARTFVSEEERGTVMTLHLIAKPSTVFFGKLFFNLILLFLMNIFTVVLYLILIPSFIIKSYDIFLLTVFLGTIGLSAASTIIAAIIAKSNTKGTLYPVLSFPILLPLLMIVIKSTKSALEGIEIAKAMGDFQVMIAYFVVITAISYLLFDYVWKD